MKSVGMYSTLIKNSWQKTTWKQYGFESMDEQVNMIYSVLLFIMEYSLREQPLSLIHISDKKSQSQYYRKASCTRGHEFMGQRYKQ